MFTPYWAMDAAEATMNKIELGFYGATDESSAILHRFVEAVPGTIYDTSHNFWNLGLTDYRR